MKTTEKHFLCGVVFAVQHLVLNHDEPSFAREIVESTGYPRDGFVAAQKHSDFCNDKMLAFFNEECRFRKEKE